MENKVKSSSNQIKPGKFGEKHWFKKRIEHFTLQYIISSLATVTWISAFQIIMRGINFCDSGGVEEKHNLFVQNFLSTVTLIDI